MLPEAWEKGSTGDFQGSETILYGAVRAGTCHYNNAFVKTHRMYSTKIEHIVNYGLWMIMTCPCQFINCDKCTTLVQDGDGRGR